MISQDARFSSSLSIWCLSVEGHYQIQLLHMIDDTCRHTYTGSQDSCSIVKSLCFNHATIDHYRCLPDKILYCDTLSSKACSGSYGAQLHSNENMQVQLEYFNIIHLTGVWNFCARCAK